MYHHIWVHYTGLLLGAVRGGGNHGISVPDGRLVGVPFGHVMCLEQDAELGSRRDALRHRADLLEDSDPDVHILIMAGQKYYIQPSCQST
jgi:hypothetical protein